MCVEYLFIDLRIGSNTMRCDMRNVWRMLENVQNKNATNYGY